MNLGLKDKVVFIAGSSRGIGREIACSFLHEGARVVISGREKSSVNGATEKLVRKYGVENVLSLIGDLTNRSFIEEALALVLEAWGKVDVLVANIGSGRTSTGWQADPEDWIPVYQKNLFGSVRLIHAALPHLIKSGQGSIFLVSSIAGIEATQAPLSYGSAKAALLHYGKNLAREVASEGVRVNVVAPGNILFPGGSWESRLEKNRDAVESYIRSEVPLKRFGRPEEIADFVVFLCSARASFATGMVLPIDGGQTRSL